MLKVWMMVVLTCMGSVCSLQVYSQTDTLFWFAAPEVLQSAPSNFDRPIFLRMSTYAQTATVTISQPAGGGMSPQVVTIPANSVQSFDLTTWIDFIENKPANTVLNNGLKISSTGNISVYYDVVSGDGISRNNPEAFVLKGHNALGTDFWIPSQSLANTNQATSFDIVATEDNTTVTITPSNNIVGHTANATYTIMLNKGQTYSASTTPGTTATGAQHLQGSRVIATEPIAITVKDDLLLGALFGGCADLAGDQIVPTNIIGTEYIAMKGLLNPPGDQVFVTATQNGTTITQNGTLMATINAGQTQQLAISTPSSYIQTSQPAYVWQLSGMGCELGAAILPKINCTGSNTIAYVRSLNLSLYFNIMVKNGGQGNFLINGTTGVVIASQFAVVPGTGGQWYAAQVSFPLTTYPQGSIITIANSTSRFHLGVIDGGATEGNSYGYFSDFGNVIAKTRVASNLICIGEEIHLFADTVPGAIYSWTGPASFSSTQQNPVIINATMTNSGIYTLAVDVTGCAQATDTVTVVVQPCTPIILNADSTILDTVYCFENVNHEIIGIPSGGYFWGCGIVDSGGKIYFNPALAAYGAGNYPHKCLIHYRLPTGQDSTCVMTVNRPVIVDAGIDQSICHNTFVLSAIGNYNHFQYAWVPAADLNTPGEPTTAGTVTATQSYTVTATDIATGCIGRDSVTIYNNTIAASFISRDSICADDTVLFTSTTTGPNQSLLWSLGDGDTSTLSSFVHTYVKGGRYIIQLSANNTLCKDTTQDTLYVFDHPIDSIALHLSDSVICTGGSVMVDVYVPAGYSGIAWDFGDGYQAINSTSFRKSYDKEGVYTIKVKGLYTACPDLDTATTLTVVVAPIVNMGKDTSICPGDPGIVLTNLHIQNGAYSSRWSTGETTDYITVVQPGTYYLTVLSGDGCATTDTIEIKPSCYMAIPNVFSPNGDGVNDYFFPRQILARGVRAFHMQIYNRWGETIFETTATTGRGWDGTFNDEPQFEGVYVYVIDATYINDVSETYKGNVTLLR